MKITRMAYDNDLNLTEITVEDYDEKEYDLKVVRHGKWEEYQIPHIICCSECDYGTCVDEKTKLCPLCGAKMDLEE